MNANITIKSKSRTSFDVLNHNIHPDHKGHKVVRVTRAFSPLSSVTGEYVDEYVKANLDTFVSAVEKHAASGSVRKIPYGIYFNDRNLNMDGADLQERLTAIKNRQFFINGEVGLSSVKSIALLCELEVKETYNNKQTLTGVTLQAQ